MSFISLFFLAFFPVVVFVYFCLPQRYRNIWLLIASYYAYTRWNGLFIFLIIYATLVSYVGGILVDKYHKKAILGTTICLNLAILFWYKYFVFFVDSLNYVLASLKLSTIHAEFDISLPVGISFFTFQAISYVIDVYRKDTPVEKNPVKYALFISFFPQLVAGPIEKAKNFMKQFDEKHSFNEHMLMSGFLQMLWGIFLKMVIADRIGVIVDTIYGNITLYSGFYMIIGAVCFMIQIFCDFAGYTTIALGAAKGLGFQLTDNFACPFFAQSVAAFWRRWHISLSSWFKEYLYFPLGGSKKGKTRKYINLLIVFAVSGMWHGASWGFLIWGLMNGLFQIIGEITYSVREKAKTFLHINTNEIMYKVLSAGITFLLVAFSFIFFRAETTQDAFHFIQRMFSEWNPWILFDGSIYNLGISEKEIRLLLCMIGVLLFADICKYKQICISDKILKQDIWGRVTIYIAIIIFLIIFAYYGEETSRFIYFAF